jgi:hypothetical protein
VRPAEHLNVVEAPRSHAAPCYFSISHATADMSVSVLLIFQRTSQSHCEARRVRTPAGECAEYSCEPSRGWVIVW